MTLDEAIAICDDIGKGDTVRAANNRWLAEKLRKLKYIEECGIVEEVTRSRHEMHEWQARCLDLTEEKQNLLHTIRLMAGYISDDRCDGCVFKSRCNAEEIERCWMTDEIVDALGEIGIEVVV